MRPMELYCRGFGDDTFGQQSGCSRLFGTRNVCIYRNREHSCLGNKVKEEEEVRHFSLACGTSVTLGLGCGCIVGVGSGVYGELLDDVDDELLASQLSGLIAPAPSTRVLTLPAVAQIAVNKHMVLATFMNVRGVVAWGGGDAMMLARGPCKLSSCATCSRLNGTDVECPMVVASPPAFVRGMGVENAIIERIAVGKRHCACLCRDDHDGGVIVYAWGSGAGLGQLGRGKGLGSCTPLNVPMDTLLHSNERIVEVACGANHSAIVTNMGVLITFGAGMHGQTGHGVCEEATLPRIVTSLRGVNPTFFDGGQTALDVIAVSCGGWHTAVLSGSGSVYSFGWARDGQIGVKRPPLQDAGEIEALPRLVDDIEDVIEVACGSRYSIARTATCIFGWGRLCPEIDMGSTPRVVYKGASQKIAAGSWHWALIDG
eukprot:170743_1